MMLNLNRHLSSSKHKLYCWESIRNHVPAVYARRGCSAEIRGPSTSNKLIETTFHNERATFHTELREQMNEGWRTREPKRVYNAAKSPGSKLSTTKRTRRLRERVQDDGRRASKVSAKTHERKQQWTKPAALYRGHSRRHAKRSVNFALMPN